MRSGLTNKRCGGYMWKGSIC